ARDGAPRRNAEAGLDGGPRRDGFDCEACLQPEVRVVGLRAAARHMMRKARRMPGDAVDAVD
ncbi:hypothetical protein, partial [Burkholderia pseudomallei]|uniref:hypothetical protein n=1 Tax=Burkholderia pseudomallei TaxID=28450 RepID=UPI001C4C25D2